MTGQIRVAQIGCGHWGRHLARNFFELGALASVADDNPETAAGMGAKFGVPVRTFGEVLASADIDAVALATPAVTHADMAILALTAGKHVFVEKPFALTIEAADRMIAAAGVADRRLMVGHLLQYHPAFVELKRQVAAGAVGRLRYVYSNRLSLGKIRTDENVLWSFAPHDFSMLLSLVDEAPESVTAQGGDFLTPGIADWCTCQLLFPSGVRGHIHVSWLHPFKEQRFVAVGEAGTLVFEDSRTEWDSKLALYRHSIDRSGSTPVALAASPEYIAVEPSEPLKLECAHFIETIAEDRRPRTDGAEGLGVVFALAAAERALACSLGKS